jgi:hypothetical protein
MQSCGAELAESAIVPERLGALLLHVSHNLVAHADWIGTASEEAQLERAALLAVAADYQAIAEAAGRAVQHMRDAAGLAPAPHDPSQWNRAAFVIWMQRKIELQRDLAQLLLDHAQASEQALAEI